jgi:tetratricopeptide (TPR) repeat protein
LDGAKALLDRARTVGETAYPGADYDVAMACFLLGRVLQTEGGSEQALSLLDEARKRFERIAHDKAAQGMASKCFADRGDCLWRLGRLDDAAAALAAAPELDCTMAAEILLLLDTLEKAR